MTDFFDQRPALAHIRDWARARQVGPLAALGVVLARTVAATPPTVVLEGVIGGEMSLNLFVGLVGPSGSGKGAAEAVGKAAVIQADWNGIPEPFPVMPVGTGEGITLAFRANGLNDDDPNDQDRVLFSAAEVDAFSAISGRSGSTLGPQMRQMWSGEVLGFANAGKATRRIVQAGSYRAALILGIQPLRAQPLLDESGGGTPQRFFLVPVQDPDAPDDPPPCPAPLTVKAPRWEHEKTVITVPAEAKQQLRAHRLAVLRGDTEVDPLLGHAMLGQLKLAAALMLLDGRSVMSTEDWRLAAHLRHVSERTLSKIRKALSEKAAVANRAKALSQADREAIIETEQQRRIAYRLLERLSDGEVWLRSDLRRSLKASLRQSFDEVMTDLIRSHFVAETTTAQSVTYQITETGAARRGGVHGYTGTPRLNIV